MTVGIICEYNPLHLGHRKQLKLVREAFGADCTIVCAMSGNFVQRGQPAILDKSLRAEAAIRCGADLVLELPIPTALSSAEGFASGGVAVLNGLCDYLCFGAETAQAEALIKTAQTLLDPNFSPLLKEELETGLSFPAARQQALERMGGNGTLLRQPNDILAVEYCKAILSQGSTMAPYPIHRPGSYHAEVADTENPSATAVRRLMENSYNWKACVPKAAFPIFEGASLHSLAFGEKAMLARLRTMTDEEFEALPYGSEGLWRKLMHASRQETTLEDIAAAVKSKRYTRSRIDRMLLCAFLGLTQEDFAAEIPYTRVLAFNDRGRTLLRQAKKQRPLLNAGEAANHLYWALEQRCGSLYGLFADRPEAPDIEKNRRVGYVKDMRYEI